MRLSNLCTPSCSPSGPDRRAVQFLSGAGGSLDPNTFKTVERRSRTTYILLYDLACRDVGRHLTEPDAKQVDRIAGLSGLEVIPATAPVGRTYVV